MASAAAKSAETAGTYLDSRSPRARIAAAGRSADVDGLGASFVDMCYHYTPPSLSHQSPSSSCPDWSTHGGDLSLAAAAQQTVSMVVVASLLVLHFLAHPARLALSAGRLAAYFASQPLPRHPAAFRPSRRHGSRSFHPAYPMSSLDCSRTHRHPLLSTLPRCASISPQEFGPDRSSIHGAENPAFQPSGKPPPMHRHSSWLFLRLRRPPVVF
ncbi:hypothetical protein R3P38DRAFT_3280998 [Favolaschia claudopus]|uniref:Uncharacterized protein n=1 Tax=Favolaschia claudopus TaxID=2862362 RepID=A0AAW0AES8_9AGAR